MGDVTLEVSEVPRCPESITRALRDFDPRLECRFNVTQRVWEVREHLPAQGVYSHCFFWHDGPWQAMRYRPLPGSADALLKKLCEIDLRRRGGDIKQHLIRLRSEGATRRAEAMEREERETRHKLIDWLKWAYKRMDVVQRRFQYGGRSRAAAIAERLSVQRELGLRREE